MQTGVFSFDPGVRQGQQDGQPDNDSGMALNASWAYTIYQNESSIQPTIWYSTHGADYSDSFSLGYDVCAISLQNVTLEAQYNAQKDNGTRLSAFDHYCVDALRSLGIATANNLVESPLSYGPDSNLTNGVLPDICDTISNKIKNNFPSECKKFWNNTIDAGGMGKLQRRDKWDPRLIIVQP